MNCPATFASQLHFCFLPRKHNSFLPIVDDADHIQPNLVFYEIVHCAIRFDLQNIILPAYYEIKKNATEK